MSAAANRYSSCSPGSSLCTVNVARVEIGAPGVVTNGTALYSDRQRRRVRSHTTYPRCVFTNLMCGFSASSVGAFAGTSAPSPPEVIEVPTNSVPIVADDGSPKSALSSATSWRARRR